MLKNNLDLLNYTNKILDDWSKEVSNFGSLSNDGEERFEIAGSKKKKSGTSSQESFSDRNGSFDCKNDTSTQMLNSTHKDKMDYNQVWETSICDQDYTIIKIEQDDETKIEPFVENSNCETSLHNDDIVSTRNVDNLDAEERNAWSMSDHIKPDIEEGIDGINNKITDTVEGITNEICNSLQAHAVKTELECSQDNISSLDDLLIPHRVRSCSPQGDGEQFEPTSSKKYRTRSSSHLPANGMAKINFGIREKLRKNLPKNTERRKNHNKPHTVQKQIETSEPVLTCNQCSYRTWNKKYMELHNYMHDNDSGIAFCRICDYVTLDKNIFVKHLIEHNGKAPFRCSLCEFTSNIPSGLIKHSKLHHLDVTKPFTCNICEYKSANNSDVVRHTRTHTGVKPFACKQCPYRSTDSSSLTFHMRSHTGEKPYSCKLCDYRTKSNSGLISHMRRHTGEKPFTCKACEHRFANHSDLVRHMKINTTDKLLNCDSCGYNSAARCALVKHLKTHTDVNAFKCVLCPFKCSRKCYLLKHMHTHNGVDVYSCDTCEFKCDTYVSFRKHKNTHGNMLACEVCSYVCVGRQVLARHMKTHGGVSYRCAECDFKCLRKCDLVEHGRLHDEKPFSCAHCKYKCRSSKTLAKHVTEAHVGKSEVEYII